MAWVLEHEATTTGTDRLVLLALANHANDNGEAWPSIDTIAREAGVQRRQTVKDALARLVAAGLIEREINGAPDHRLRADRRPNLYRLTGARLTAPRGGTGAREASPGDEPTGARFTASRGHASRSNGGTGNEPLTVTEPSSEPPPPTRSNNTDCTPADPAAPVVVDQPTTLRAIRLVAEAQAERGAKTNPTGFAHAAKARMANPEDPDRQRIDSELAAGRSPTDIAAGWHTAPADYPSVDHAAQERPRLTEVKPDKTPRPPKAVGLAGAAAARAALRRRSEVVPS